MKAILALILLLAATIGVYQYWYLPKMTPKGESEQAAEAVVGLGKVLQLVPLTADPDAVIFAMNQHYKPFVAPLLLAEWKDDQKTAPGRSSSSPWPARIDLDTIAGNGDGSFIVRGRIIEITSKELVEGGSAREYAIVASVDRTDEGWRITSFARE